MRVARLPLIVVLMAVSAAAMLVPCVAAYLARDLHAAQMFLYPALMLALLSTLVGFATAGWQPFSQTRSHLLGLIAAYAALPALLAVPVFEAVPGVSFLDAWFEMVSSFTTTGATVFDPPASVVPAVHLWRALVGWLGGFFVWTTAIAILAPLNLGGFEVTSAVGVGRSPPSGAAPGTVADPSVRLARHAAALAPLYAGLTLVLAVVLLALGEAPLVAAAHAMSTLSTSGISPVGGTPGAGAGRGGEAAIFLVLVFALSRQTFATDFQPESVRRLRADPELRMGLACVAGVPLLLFLRHWVGTSETAEGLEEGLRALWGGLFTVLSFLSTTGFVSADWAATRAWSAVETPTLILAGLAILGGGVATTAGGVKLLRVYALYKHGAREMERLVHPSSVAGAGPQGRRLRREGAYIAWISFMLFALSIAAVMAALSLLGLDFETAMVLAVAALSTTGPLVGAAADPAISYAALDAPAKAILAAAMVLGRLETLAIIALLNPEFWRN